MSSAETFLHQAIDLAMENVRKGGRPFGAVVVIDGEVVATGVNSILASGDPTAHAELDAIRAASRKLGKPRLDGATIYASGQPCPMCLAAMYLTGVSEVHFAYSNAAGEAFGLSTARIYDELARPPESRALKMTCTPVRPDGKDLYEAWKAHTEQSAG